jgi:predicted GH43/DUF377 family glycosyl hydrolase
VLSIDGWALKDPCIVRRDGAFYIYFSAIFADGGADRFHVAAVATEDFRSFSDPLFIWSGREVGHLGMASPDVQLVGETYYLTYSTYGETKDGPPPEHPNQLFYAASRDGRTWDAHKPLAVDVTAGVRSIDPTLARVGARWVLTWKRMQTPTVAVAEELSGPWRVLGSPTLGWFENAQNIVIDGRRRMVFSNRHHQTCLAEVPHLGVDDADWLEWTGTYALDIPRQRFNAETVANAGCLADWREHDGHFYLLSCGRSHGQWHSDGDYRLGLARSRDLVHWQVPADVRIPKR